MTEDELYFPCVECGEPIEDERKPFLCDECRDEPVYFLRLIEPDPEGDPADDD